MKKKTTIMIQMKGKSMAHRTDTLQKAHLTGEFVVFAKFGLANVVRQGWRQGGWDAGRQTTNLVL